MNAKIAKKILICTPCMEMMHVGYVKCLEDLDRSCGNVDTAFVENSLVYDAREKLCQIALAAEADYILWIDSDMTFPSTALKDLLADDKDIVCGLCFRRRPPFTPAMWKTIRYGLDTDNVIEQYPDYPRDSLFEIDGTGMAFCLVKTEVIRKVYEKYGTCYMPLHGFGEDVSFCVRAKTLGYSIWCDSRLKIGHIGIATYNEATYLSLKEEQDADKS